MISVYFDAIVVEPFNEGVIRLYILNELRKIGTEIKRDFDRTVKTWNNKPKFETIVHFGATELSIEVGTDDENYRRVSEGTSGKPRVARGAGALPGAKALTLVPYIAKTVPGQIDARAGGRQEGTVIFRRYALNAGKIAPREFDELIQKLWDPKFPDRMQKALDAAAVKTGFAF